VLSVTLAAKAVKTLDPTEKEALYREAVKEIETAVESVDDWMKGTFAQGDFQSKPDRDRFFTELRTHPKLQERFRVAAAKLEPVL